METKIVTMEEKLRNNLRVLVDTYAVFHTITETQAARLLFGDGSYFWGPFQQRKNVASFRVRTYDIIVARFSERWPAGLDWPAGIDRITPENVPGMPGLARKPRSGGRAGKDQPKDAAA